MIKKYTVTMKKRCICLEFDFGSMEEAVSFIESALNGYRVSDDEDPEDSHYAMGITVAINKKWPAK